MVDYKKVIKDTLKREREELREEYKKLKDFIKTSIGNVNISQNVKKSIKKLQRSESRIAQRTGNKYMIGKKTTRVKQKAKKKKKD